MTLTAFVSLVGCNVPSDNPPVVIKPEVDTIYYTSKDWRLVIPKSFTPISNTCVEGKGIIVYERFADNVLPDSTFEDCDNLASIKLSEYITSIGRKAFYGCGGLVKVNLPPYLESIEWYAFDGCYSLNSIVIPSCVERIGEYAFHYAGLVSIYCEAPIPPVLSRGAFYLGHDVNVYVPRNSLVAYKGAEDWKAKTSGGFNTAHNATLIGYDF